MKNIITIVLFIFIIFYTSFIYGLTADEVIELKRKGFSNEEIRNIANKGKPDANRNKKFDSIQYLQEHVKFISVADKNVRRLNTTEIDIKFLDDRVGFYTEGYILGTNNKASKKIIILYESIKKVEPIMIEISDYMLKVPILGLLTSYEKIAFKIRVYTKKLKRYDFFIKCPDCQSMFVAEKVKSSIETLAKN